MNKFMLVALNEAKKAYKNGDIPVGAVIVQEEQIIAKAYNQKNKLGDPTKHAEIIAIQRACKKLGDFRLENCEIYITKEPCIMCYGAILSARLKKVYFGAYDTKYSILSLKDNFNFNHACDLVGGVEEEKCSNILSQFFSELRGKKCK